MTEQIRANTLFDLDVIRIHLSASRCPGFLSDDVDSFLLPPRQLGRNKRLETVSEYEFVYCHKNTSYVKTHKPMTDFKGPEVTTVTLNNKPIVAMDRAPYV